MRYKFLKSKASFMVYLIICMSFTVGLMPQASAEDNMACCEQTLSGETCRYTFADECDTGYKTGNFQQCEDTSFCKPGCCISPEGSCSMQVSKAKCESMGEGWSWTNSPYCEIQQCQKGCCVLAESECTYTTEKRCASITSQFEGLELDFRESNSEADCTAICKQSDKGCCVANDGTCTWQSRAACGLDDGSGTTGFYKDVYCSHNSLQSSCSPKCKAQAYKGCIEGEEDVYWFDSCGNPEGIAEDCDYAYGTLCSNKDEDHDTAYCKSVNCETTKDYEHIGYDGGFRWNGESWCYYDSIPGAGLDTVGSRHFRHICINGEELVEPCKDFREETCLQMMSPEVGELGEFRSGNCMENNWQVCMEECNSAQGLEGASDAELQRAYRIDKKCCIQNNCVWYPLDQTIPGDEDRDDGLCVPRDPPGGKFWTEDDGEVDDKIEEQCNLADVGEDECNVKWAESYYGADMQCVSRCDCYTEDFLNMKNRYCNSVGDCGAFFNYVGDWENFGLYRDWEGNPEKQDGATPLREVAEKSFSEYSFVPEDYMPEMEWDQVMQIYRDLPEMEWDQVMQIYRELRSTGTTGGLIGAGALVGIGGIHAAAEGLAISAMYAAVDAGTISAASASTVASAATMSYVAAAVAAILFVAGLATGDRQLLTAAEYAGYIGGASAVVVIALTVAAGTAEIPIAGWIAAAVALLVAATATLLKHFAKSEKRLVTIDCEPWSPPDGGENCHVCDEDPMHPCSEYRCKSLGTACEFIEENQGTDRETCYAAESNDVEPPIISAWLDNNSPLAVWERIDNQRVNNNQEYNVNNMQQESIGGYRITTKIPAFTAISVGIKTNELAQCKYTTEFDKEMTFSKLPHFFGDNYYKKEHNITVYGLTPKTKFEYYILCRDANNNPKQDQIMSPYKIEFSTDNSPDLTPPFIIGAEPQNGGFVKATSTVAYPEFIVDEPNAWPQMCKHSAQDMDYELMENNMSCWKAPENSIHQQYTTCYANMSINEGTNSLYMRCKDEKGNYNEEPYIYSLTKSEPLKISSISPPAGTEYFTVNATLQVQTEGGSKSGVATCSFFEPNKGFSDYFYLTNSTYHEQHFTNLIKGEYEFKISCYDSVGNEAIGQTNFSVTADLDAPNLIAVYKSSSGLNVILDEIATCEYAEESFSYGTGTVSGTETEHHVLSAGMEKYHLSCKDIYGNLMPEIIIRPEIKIA